MNAETLLASTVGTFMLDDLVGDGYANGACVAALSTAALYNVVAFSAREASSQRWHSTSIRGFPWDERVGRDVALELASGALAGEAARWWSDTAATHPQVWLGESDAVPVPGLVAPALYGKPANVIWTSSAIEGLPSAWWPVLRRGPDGPPPTTTRSIWRLTPRADARVYEIGSPDDWAGLCEAFPFVVVDGYVGPDWDAVARDYDGVHLTVEGLITAQCVEVETRHGTAKLDSWDAESTAWLRWCFDRVERIGEVDPD